MASFAFARAVRAASGILRPLNILASSTYRNCVKNASLISALSTGRFSHIQTPVVSSTPRLTTSERNLTFNYVDFCLIEWETLTDIHVSRRLRQENAKYSMLLMLYVCFPAWKLSSKVEGAQDAQFVRMGCVCWSFSQQTSS
ncbi:hypothetical protein H8959_013513 [Pygathrix nigripes]